MKKSLVQKVLLGAVAVLGLAAAGVGTADGVIRPCVRNINCLDVWNPVICPNGQVYSNSCYAYRACQTNCVPWGGDTY